MLKKDNIIALIGDTKFEDLFSHYQKQLTLQGNIVLSPCIFSQSDPEYMREALSSTEVVEMLDELGKQRITMADWVLVLNPDYDKRIRYSTQLEINYATSLGKNIEYLNDLD